MNYIKQINAFYKLIQNNPLSSNAQCLYNYLLNKNSELGWVKEFSVSNMIVCGFTCLSRQALDRARNELKQKGYIDYKKGISNQAGKYLIVSFDTQDDTQNNTQDNTQGNTQSGHTASTLNKRKETKQNIKRYGESKNVFFTDEQYEKLKAIFPNDYKKRIQTLDDYIQSTGKKYKDCLATLRNWARRDGYVFPNEKKQEEYKETTMTEEEYFRKLNEGGKRYV